MKKIQQYEKDEGTGRLSSLFWERRKEIFRLHPTRVNIYPKIKVTLCPPSLKNNYTF